MKVTRRRIAAAAALAAVPALAAAYLVGVEPRRLQVMRWRVRIDWLPPDAEGLRIVHLSDLHVGMFMHPQRHVRRAIRAAVGAGPDVVFITGDIMHGGRWRRSGNVFAPLTSRCPTFAVLGNHDHLGSPADTESIVAGLRAQGVKVLMNEHAELGLRRLPWHVVGVDDLVTHHADFDRAVEGIPAGSRLLALLTHVPDIADLVPPGWFSLMFAGHTHGIDVKAGPLERLRWVRRRVRPIQSRYPQGFFEVGGALLHVSRGIGMSEFPIRGGSVPEVTVLELTAAPLLDNARYHQLET